MHLLTRCRAREGATVVEGADSVNRNEYLFAEFALNLLVTRSVLHTCRLRMHRTVICHLSRRDAHLAMVLMFHTSHVNTEADIHTHTNTHIHTSHVNTEADIHTHTNTHIHTSHVNTEAALIGRRSI
jgi:hypothetical protein